MGLAQEQTLWTSQICSIMLLIGLLLILLAIAISSFKITLTPSSWATEEIFNRNITSATYSEANTEANCHLDSQIPLKNVLVEGRITSIVYNRITMILLVFSAGLTYHINYLQIQGSGIGIYNGLFQVTNLTESFEIFLYLIGSIILILTSTFSKSSLKNQVEISLQNSLIAQLTGKVCSFFRLSHVFPQGFALAMGEKLNASDPKSVCYPNIQNNPLTVKYLPNSQFNLNVMNNNLDLLDNNYAKPEGLRFNEYPILLLFQVIGGSFLISSCDLISMFLSLELQSYALYIVSSVNKDSQKATSAGLKYFLLGSLSSTFILLGSCLVYGYTGITSLDGIYILFAISEFSISLQIAFIIIIVGFLFKIGAAPFHSWSPDVYDSVPTIVTTWIAIIPKITIFIFLFEFVTFTNFSVENIDFTSASFTNPYGIAETNIPFSSLGLQTHWTNILLLSSTLSLIIGTVVGLTQTRIKRLLAYSSISNVGFLLLALAINSPDSFESFIFYLVQYSITNVNIFFVLIALGILYHQNCSKNYESYDNDSSELGDKYSPIQYLSQLKGLFQLNSFLAFSFAISLFSFAGIPPLVGFFAKQMVLLSALKNGFIFLAILGILASVISASYYLKIVKLVFFDKPSNLMNSKALDLPTFSSSDSIIRNETEENTSILLDHNSLYLHHFLSYIISVITLVILFFLLKPQFILNSAHLLALSVYFY